MSERMIKGSPAKLRNGGWGVRIKLEQKFDPSGHRVEITTKDGKSWVAKIDKVLWSGDQDDGFVVLASTEQIPNESNGATAKSAPRKIRDDENVRYGLCRDCGDEGFSRNGGPILCWDCRDIIAATYYGR